jgi:hypothetical protein
MLMLSATGGTNDEVGEDGEAAAAALLLPPSALTSTSLFFILVNEPHNPSLYTYILV